jgi:hypothetical protein
MSKDIEEKEWPSPGGNVCRICHLLSVFLSHRVAVTVIDPKVP